MKTKRASGDGNPKRAAWMTGLPIELGEPSTTEPPGVYPVSKKSGFARAGKIEGQPSSIFPQNASPPPPSSPGPTPPESQRSTPRASKKSPKSLGLKPIDPFSSAPLPVRASVENALQAQRLTKAPSWIGPNAVLASPFSAVSPLQPALSILEAEGILSVPVYDPADVARSILEYALRPLDGVVTSYQEVVSRDRKRAPWEDPQADEPTTPVVVQTQVSLPVPSFQEIARCLGYTKRELEKLGRTYPATVGRALEILRGVIEDVLSRRALEGKVDSRYAMFIADNYTDMKIKKQVESLNVNLSDVLKKIEESRRPLRNDEF